MLDTHIYEHRIKRLVKEMRARRYSNTTNLRASYIYDPKAPIPYTRALKARYKPIAPGTRWGELWGSGWFRFEGTIPAAFKGREVVALIDVGGEGCVFVDGEPVQGLTNKWAGNTHTPKRIVPITRKAKGGEKVKLLVEVAANELFGAHGGKAFVLNTAEIACLDRQAWRLEFDVRALESSMRALEKDSPRRNRILRGLNQIANVWNEGRGIDECLRITNGILSSRANASACTAYSIGHAHLDLGWLWPTRETKRKGGRTFSTALRLMEEYPEYKFGASQAQLYEWIKEEYPGLYRRVKRAVAAGRWECQGAMWVEPDMNITGGESLVRQCLYGKALYRDEFGVDVKNLWLPDVFGYSAALPQILKKCGVDYFMTQKISWSETNTFPHHTFMWEGIDGTRILSHFLPANTYNCPNWPETMARAEKRYAQNDVSGEFLNLYGTGDGGGGPGRIHIELGQRQTNLEGTPKFKFAFAEEFFRKIDRIPKKDLPLWVGELYLELHRGTYTTQGRMKRDNRLLELRLRDTELLCAVAGIHPKAELDRIWKNTLLNQFHDILPGSSIGRVYQQAHEESERNLDSLTSIRTDALEKLYGKAGTRSETFVIYNTLSWDRTGVVSLPAPSNAQVRATGPDGAALLCERIGRQVLCMVHAPSMGYTTVKLAKGHADAGQALTATTRLLENGQVRVRIAADGTISSIYDKELDRETLAGPANELLLWEDRPRDWDAWDISHYYRQTTPLKPKRTSVSVDHANGLSAAVAQRFTVSNSTIEQRIVLEADSKLVRIENTVEWNEEFKMLRVGARPDVHTDHATFEIQYGTIRRPTHANTSWDRARFEVAGQRFADLSQHDRGFALVNDCKYGHYVRGNVMELTLLRSPKDPDSKADIGSHEFTFGYLPHAGRLEESEVQRTAHELNSPLIAAPVAKAPAEQTQRFFRVRGGTVEIEAVKPAEDGSGVVVRMYETAGGATRVTFEARNGWRKLVETTMLEEPLRTVAKAGHRTTLRFTPFEIRTFLLG